MGSVDFRLLDLGLAPTCSTGADGFFAIRTLGGSSNEGLSEGLSVEGSCFEAPYGEILVNFQAFRFKLEFAGGSLHLRVGLPDLFLRSFGSSLSGPKLPDPSFDEPAEGVLPRLRRPHDQKKANRYPESVATRGAQPAPQTGEPTGDISDRDHGLPYTS